MSLLAVRCCFFRGHCLRCLSSTNFDNLLSNLRNVFEKTVFKRDEHVAPPQALPRPGARVHLHNHIIQDDFSWLHDLKRQDVKALIRDENRYVKKITRDTTSFQDILVKKLQHLVERIEDCENANLPVEFGNYIYYTKESGSNSNLVMHCRRRKDIDSPEEVIFDESSADSHWAHIGVKSMKVSPSEQFVAFVVDVSGSDSYCGIVIDMQQNPGKVVEQLPSVNLEWGGLDKVLYYTTFDHLKRANKVWRHIVGLDPSADELIFEEMDPRFYVDVSSTKDRQFITINSNSKSTSEVQVLDSTQPDAAPRLVRRRETDVEYYVEHHGGKFYILTNLPHGEDYQVMTVDEKDMDPNGWTTLVPSSEKVILEDMDIFSGYCVLYQKENTSPRLSVIPLHKPSSMYTVKLPNSTCVLTPGYNLDFNSSTVNFTTSSPIEVPRWTELNLKTKEMDGTEVPMTIFHKNDIELNGQHPILIHVYGSYGINVNMDFSLENYHLLTEGWVLAFCHVRGGGELGRQWYHRGRLENKAKCFEDFEACVHELQQQGYSSPRLTAVIGTSAGGLPVAVLCNNAPQLFQAAVLKVPFVDVMTAMLDQDLALTAQEYEEFGNPRLDVEVIDNLRSFCPYLNISSQDYPNMLFTSSLNDVRVPYWMPLKFVHKLRHMRTTRNSSKPQNMLLLKTDFESGHFGASTFEEVSRSLSR